MSKVVSRLLVAALLLVVVGTTLPGCGQSGTKKVTLYLVAYSTPQAVYAKIIPMFEAWYKKNDNEQITINQSYGGSGSQAQAVIGGNPANIVALSLAGDVNKIEKAGLITSDWTKVGSYNGLVSDSVVVFGVRKGNPKGIKDWGDLVASKLEYLTPNPQTSGGAQWNILAAYGAVKRGNVPGYDASDAGAMNYLSALFKNVTSMDKDAATSLTTFDNGNGNVAITYENSMISTSSPAPATNSSSVLDHPDREPGGAGG